MVVLRFGTHLGVEGLLVGEFTLDTGLDGCCSLIRQSSLSELSFLLYVIFFFEQWTVGVEPECGHL